MVVLALMDLELFSKVIVILRYFCCSALYFVGFFLFFFSPMCVNNTKTTVVTFALEYTAFLPVQNPEWCSDFFMHQGSHVQHRNDKCEEVSLWLPLQCLTVTSVHCRRMQ